MDESNVYYMIGKWAESAHIQRPRSALECVTAGIQMVMVKKSIPHGTFRDWLNGLGFRSSYAVKYMACARRFDPVKDRALIEAAGSPGKLIELLALTADEVRILASGAQVRGLSMETLPGMTILQLRAAFGRSAGSKKEVFSADEELLMRNYRKCSQDAKGQLVSLARLMANAVLPVKPAPVLANAGGLKG